MVPRRLSVKPLPSIAVSKFHYVKQKSRHPHFVRVCFLFTGFFIVVLNALYKTPRSLAVRLFGNVPLKNAPQHFAVYIGDQTACQHHTLKCGSLCKLLTECIPKIPEQPDLFFIAFHGTGVQCRWSRSEYMPQTTGMSGPSDPPAGTAAGKQDYSLQTVFHGLPP